MEQCSPAFAYSTFIIVICLFDIYMGKYPSIPRTLLYLITGIVLIWILCASGMGIVAWGIVTIPMLFYIFIIAVLVYQKGFALQQTNKSDTCSESDSQEEDSQESCQDEEETISYERTYIPVVQAHRVRPPTLTVSPQSPTVSSLSPPVISTSPPVSSTSPTVSPQSPTVSSTSPTVSSPSPTVSSPSPTVSSPSPSPTASPFSVPPPVVETTADVVSNVVNVATQDFANYMNETNTDRFLDFSQSSYSIVYLIQDGVPDFWKRWVETQVNLISNSKLNLIKNTVYVVIPLTKEWFLEQHTQIANAVLDSFNIADVNTRNRIIQRHINGQSNQWQTGAPAWGAGDFPSLNFNLEVINTNNLIVTDSLGILQMPGHEFFHNIQNSGLQTMALSSFLPNWFKEGSASFVGMSIANISNIVQGYNYTLWRSAMVNRNSESVQNHALSEITSLEREPDAYGIGAIAVEYMVAWFGMQKFMNILIETGNAINRQVPPPNSYNSQAFETGFLKATGVQLRDFYDSFESVRELLGFNRTGAIIREPLPSYADATDDALELERAFQPSAA